MYKINEILALMDCCMDLKIRGGEQNGLMFYKLHLCTYFWRRGWGHFVRLKIYYAHAMLYLCALYPGEQLLFIFIVLPGMFKNQCGKTWFLSFIDLQHFSVVFKIYTGVSLSVDIALSKCFDNILHSNCSEIQNKFVLLKM